MNVKAVIFAGGFGTRIAEESDVRPKPMVEVGGQPILWHIMKTFSHFGVNDFIVCLGYKGKMIKEYFANYFLYTSDVTIDLARNEMRVHEKHAEPWRVTLVDTGDGTLTGGRLKRVQPYLVDDDLCFLTYGDGVADIDLVALLDHHRAGGRLVTVTAVQAPPRWGNLEITDGQVRGFTEKCPEVGDVINGGFFAMDPAAIDYVEGDQSSWEAQALPKIAADGQLTAYRHTGFWQAMDTLRDKRALETLWAEGRAPWAVWQHQPPRTLSIHQRSVA